MLTRAAQGEHIEVDLYMLHAQDHLMNGITFRDLAVEIIALYEREAGSGEKYTCQKKRIN